MNKNIELTNDELDILIELTRKVFLKHPTETRFYNLKVKLEKMKGE